MAERRNRILAFGLALALFGSPAFGEQSVQETIDYDNDGDVDDGDLARAAQNPPIARGDVAYSDPPASMTSASPCSILRPARPMQCAEVAHAVTIDRFGPVMFCMILT